MLDQQQVDHLIEVVSSMDRDDLCASLLSFTGRFPVDFTAEYLQELSLDRLRHILVAACLQAGQLPESAVAHAA